MASETLDSSIGSPLYTPVKSSRLYEQIVEQVEKSIRNGQLQPGGQLPAERELAQTFGVSRTAVREAIKALREKGLVEVFSGRGTYVIHPAQPVTQSLDLRIRISQEESAMHLAELRQILEPGIAALAASRIEEQLLATLREALATMDRSLHNPDAYVEADLDFHLALAEAAGNPLVLSLFGFDRGSFMRAAQQDLRGGWGAQRGQFHHKRILQAVERRDPDEARQAMRDHQQQVREDSASACNTGLKPTS